MPKKAKPKSIQHSGPKWPSGDEPEPSPAPCESRPTPASGGSPGERIVHVIRHHLATPSWPIRQPFVNACFAVRFRAFRTSIRTSLLEYRQLFLGLPALLPVQQMRHMGLAPHPQQLRDPASSSLPPATVVRFAASPSRLCDGSPVLASVSRPEGTSENSPAFQRWDSNPKAS